MNRNKKPYIKSILIVTMSHPDRVCVSVCILVGFVQTLPTTDSEDTVPHIAGPIPKGTVSVCHRSKIKGKGNRSSGRVSRRRHVSFIGQGFASVRWK